MLILTGLLVSNDDPTTLRNVLPVNSNGYAQNTVPVRPESAVTPGIPTIRRKITKSLFSLYNSLFRPDHPEF